METKKTSIDELFRLVMLDVKRKVKLNIELVDEENDIIELRETIEKLTEYVGDKLQDEGENSCKQQIFPLMANAMVGGMTKLFGAETASYYLANEAFRYSLTHMMTVSFYLLKWIQKKNIKINTFEESISDTDIDMYKRLSKTGDTLYKGTAMGLDPNDILQKLYEDGKITIEDVEKMGGSLSVNKNKINKEMN